jgi:hypothetical protein
VVAAVFQSPASLFQNHIQSCRGTVVHMDHLGPPADENRGPI